MKSPAINELIFAMTGKDLQATIRAGLCMTCDGKAGVFNDRISVQEYKISGMCQKCQDKTYV